MDKRTSVKWTVEQAQALIPALDFYCRMGLGQVTEIGFRVRMDHILSRSRDRNEEFRSSEFDVCEKVDYLIREWALQLFYPSGGSYGMGHRCVHEDANRSWEIKKVIDKVVSEELNPNPNMRGVNYDGLSLRYTRDLAPEATVTDPGTDQPAVSISLSDDQLRVVLEASELMLDLFRGDYQAITRLAEREFLIPFNRQGFRQGFAQEDESEHRPVMSESQMIHTRTTMDAIQKCLGFYGLVSLSDQEVPDHIQNLVEAHAEASQAFGITRDG